MKTGKLHARCYARHNPPTVNAASKMRAKLVQSARIRAGRKTPFTIALTRR